MENNYGKEFPAFPYEPYSIQLDFMKFLYESLDRGGISMLESPTGTGKTLSIICSALQWLVDRKKENLKNNQAVKADEGNEDDDEPDWLRDYKPFKESESENRKILVEKKKFVARSEDVGSKKGKGEVLKYTCSSNPAKGGKTDATKMNGKANDGVEEVDDAEFLLEEYDSDGESSGKRKNVDGDSDFFSSEEEEDMDGFKCEEEKAGFKVYFCSRTHSQLSQFMKELKKTIFASELKVVCLGSRKNLCINEEVMKLGNTSRINERCLELQKSKKREASKAKKLNAGKTVRRTKASSGCPMLRRRKIEDLRNAVIQLEALDIEDFVQIGHNLGSCPYYGSRRMLPVADLVVLPYQSLLSKSTRESLGLNLKDSIVIVDEAHNLADTLISMYDAKITLAQLTRLEFQLDGYFQRFCNVLGPGNRRYIQTLMILNRAFLKMLRDNVKTATLLNASCDDEEITNSTMTINEFLFALNIDNINLVKLLQYMKESNIIHKVSGYGDKVIKAQRDGHSEADGAEESAVSGFRALIDILSSLTNSNPDGKIIVSRPRKTCNDIEGGYIKYVMLTGEKIFSQIVDQAYAVILAGGTLQPIEETKERLFPSLNLDELRFFSCGHIISSKNILPIAVEQGPSGQQFDFSFKARSSLPMIEELGRMLSNLVAVVPEGIVVFFSSFDYENRVYDAWKSSGILSRITKKKRIFREPRKSTDIEAVLREYKETIDSLSTNDSSSSCNGAILLAVVGGKISEGINFSDGAGRCIVMVGLPYPSPSDIELMERVKHIEGLEKRSPSKTILKPSVFGECDNGNVESGLQILRSCKGRGKEYYENLCMKAVNQSIGRAIRHVNDYAAILLVDKRYASDSMRRSTSHPTEKLPQWIKSRLVDATANYGEVHRLLHQFFKSHKKKSVSDANVTGRS